MAAILISTRHIFEEHARTLDDHYTDYEIPWNLIEQLCKEKKIDDKVLTAFRNNIKLDKTFYVQLDISRLLDDHKIDSSRLFQEMRQFSGKQITLADAKKVLDDNKYAIDWYDGSAFKMRFRKTMKEPQLFPLQRIDDRRGVGFSYLFLLTFLDKLMKPNDG